MAKRQNDDPEPEPVPADEEKRLDHPFVAAKLRPKATPHDEPPPCPPLPGQQSAGDPVRVLLTGDNRSVITEAYVPEEAFGFRINVDGQFFEHVADAADSGTWIFAPTR